MSHDLHSDVGAYVADALDDDEREAFEAHLPDCPSCRREVTEFRETVSRLSVVSETAPPPALRASVLAAIAQVRPLPPEVQEEPSTSVAPPLVAAAPPRRGLPEEGGTDEGPVDELAVRRQRRVTRLLTGLVAAAVVVALAVGGWAVTLQQRVETIVAESQVRTELLSAPDVEAVSVPLPDGGHVGYTLSRQQDRAILSAAALAETEPGKVYQLWTMQIDEEAGTPIEETVRPNATFTGGEDVSVLFDQVSDTEALAITVEPDTGSTMPTTTPFGVAQV
ncbi:anti-sigma factor [Auraticoccus monumenti]|uniref:Regulator of SigK n=1 Tax=Auraticoccus monumenti TaxID=675864 RepID=A0A1G6UB51_9ACTN|nr:anti-sigma factor [Auraticoccus monumenti]SDD38474.1 Putative zinc-finger [Auraticoccus monumenti]